MTFAPSKPATPLQTPPIAGGQPLAQRGGGGPGGTNVGLFGGAYQFIRGVAFLGARPSLWGLSMVPLLVASMIASVGLVVAWWGASAIVAPHLVGADGLAAAKFHAAQLLLFLAFALFAVLLGAALAQPLSGVALEKLVARTEAELRVVRMGAAPEESLARRLRRSLLVNLLGLLFAACTLGPLAIITFLFPPVAVVTVPLKFCASSLVVAWDFLDYPLEVRGGGVRKRLDWFLAHFPAVFGFGAAATSLLLVPFVALLVLPAGVVGATHLVTKVEGTRPSDDE